MFCSISSTKYIHYTASRTRKALIYADGPGMNITEAGETKSQPVMNSCANKLQTGFIHNIEISGKKGLENRTFSRRSLRTISVPFDCSETLLAHPQCGRGGVWRRCRGSCFIRAAWRTDTAAEEVAAGRGVRHLN